METDEAKFNTEISNYIFYLLDDDDTFEEFNTDKFRDIDEKDVQVANNLFARVENTMEYNHLLFSVWSCMLIKVLCEDYNSRYRIDVQLTEIGCFNEYFIFLIDNAKYVSKMLDADIKECIYNTFVIANATFQEILKRKDNKSELKYIRKYLFKPIMKLFIDDYKYVYKLKKAYGY